MDTRLRLISQAQGGVFGRSQALSSGYSADRIARLLRDGTWVRIRRGQYAEVGPDPVEPWERARQAHLLKVHAAMNSLRPRSVAVSHQSALLLHGLPLWGLDLSRVHVNRLDGHSGGIVAGVHHHLGKLTEDDLTVAGGRLATNPARAVVETACTTSFEVAVVSIDAALREHNIRDDDIQRLLELSEFWPGSTTARSALRLADGASESVGESRLRVLLYLFGLPEPVLQAEFYDSDGLIGRVDFYFPEYNTVLEFDGLLKYGGGSEEVLIREKRREDRLRALGLHVVRIIWPDLDRPADLVTGIRHAFTRANRAA